MAIFGVCSEQGLQNKYFKMTVVKNLISQGELCKKSSKREKEKKRTWAMTMKQ